MFLQNTTVGFLRTMRDYPCLKGTSKQFVNFKRWTIFFLICFSCILTFQSCIIYNSTKRQDSNICSRHKSKMTKTIVGTRFGKTRGGNASFPNAKARRNMGCVVSIWPIRRLAIIYHCTKCDSLQREFKKTAKANPEFQK